MKKKLLAVVALLAISLGIFSLAYAGSPIKLILNGKELKSDVPPQNVNSRVLVPIRVISEAFGAKVSWDSKNNAVIIESKTDSNKDTSQESRISQLERALAPKNAEDAVNTWAEAVKSRNGAVEYAVLSPELKKAMYSDFEETNWVTGVSSPWVDSYKITDLGKADDGSYRYKVDMVWKTSADSSTGEEYIIVKEYDGNFFVSSIGKVDIRGEITQLDKEDNKTTGMMVEGKIESDTAYDKAKVKINDNTKIYDASTGKTLSAADLKEGMKVEVIFAGAVNYSYPVQAGAFEIRVIE